MEPALSGGDRLLVIPLRRLQRGDIVAARDPRQPARVIVKRVAGIDSGAVELRGDNAPHSTDSRHFGWVARPLVIGRAVYRYHPIDRAGWLPTRPTEPTEALPAHLTEPTEAPRPRPTEPTETPPTPPG